MKMKDKSRTELLAPAGSAEALRAVIAAGADAVYIGGSRFGARAYADNPGEEELLDAIDYAHLRGVKVYMTVNTLLKEQELKEAAEFVLPYYRRGVDAVLVQDFGVLRVLRRSFPDLPLHASTQMTVTGPESARLLMEQGITRVVPARELSIDELTAIRDVGVEVETFVHGALCVCYSGQCLYSSMLGGRSGNRGRCAQPCRLLYLKDHTEYDGSHSILEEREARHFLSPKDLQAIELLPELVAAGIDSLKIEGRMKKPEYAAGVVSVYRKYLDLLLAHPEWVRRGDTASPSAKASPFHVEKQDLDTLMTLYNRTGFTDGYFHRHNGPGMMAPVKHELTPAEAEERQRLYGVMRGRYMEQEAAVPVSIRAAVFAGKPVRGDFSARGHRVSVTGEVAQEAVGSPLSEERIQASLSKTGGSDFAAAGVRVQTDGTSFVPVRALNELRRQGMEALRESILADYRRRGECLGKVLCAEDIAASVPDTGQSGVSESAVPPALATDSLGSVPQDPSGTAEGAPRTAAAGPAGKVDVQIGTAGDAPRLPAAGLAGKVDVQIGTAGNAPRLPAAGLAGKDDVHIGTAGDAPRMPAAGPAGKDDVQITALVSTEEQLRAVLSVPEVGCVCLEGSLLLRQKDPEAFGRKWAGEIGGAEKMCGLAFPYIDRGGKPERKLREMAPALRDAGFTLFLVRSLETAAALIAEGLGPLLRADAGLYTYNTEAAVFLREQGIPLDTAPYELNRKELFGRDNSRSELAVYGRLPLMVTAQCLVKNTEGCSRRFEMHTLTDRMGADFVVTCDCIFCYNVIRNSACLNLLGEMPSIRRMGFPSVRLMFTRESGEEARRIAGMAAAACAAAGGMAGRGSISAGGVVGHGSVSAGGVAGRGHASPGSPGAPAGTAAALMYTKGHFLRGVE